MSVVKIIKDLFISLRPKQWIKNSFVLAAVFFVREFSNVTQLGKALGAAFLFCIVSSAVYLINDCADVARDRQHPVKRFRPIAAGKLSFSLVFGLALVLFALALGIAFYFNFLLGLTLAGYIVLQIAYSFLLKKIVIVDVIVIALGFVLRVVAGAVVISVTFSAWLIFCTFFLTLFLAVSKRKSELLLSSDAKARSVLASYSLPFLDRFLMISVCIFVFALFYFVGSQILYNQYSKDFCVCQDLKSLEF
jgi:4-hydroxybenzoate polyprenyltransferase